MTLDATDNNTLAYNTIIYKR